MNMAHDPAFLSFGPAALPLSHHNLHHDTFTSQVSPRKSLRPSKSRCSPMMTATKQQPPTPPTDQVVDLYAPFWAHADKVLKSRLSDLESYPIPEGFKHKEAITGKGKRQALVRTDSHAYRTDKLRQIRAAHVRGGKALQVLNFVMFPDLRYRLPFFGADLVTLPGGHLIAIDMQPLFHTDEYRKEFSEPLMETFEKLRKDLPWGGDFPEEAKPFFSPCFIWSRPSHEEFDPHVFNAFKEYLDAYLDFVDKAEPVTDPEELEEIRKSQLAYLKYRAEKDPARGMFLRFYGEDWTEEYIHGFLFDLERKIEAGEYVPPKT